MDLFSLFRHGLKWVELGGWVVAIANVFAEVSKYVLLFREAPTVFVRGLPIPDEFR
jgi:hypothetical protein